MRALYADYLKADIYRLYCPVEAASPMRRIIRPSVAINGDYMLPDAAPLPLDQALLAAEMDEPANGSGLAAAIDIAR